MWFGVVCRLVLVWVVNVNDFYSFVWYAYYVGCYGLFVWGGLFMFEVEYLIVVGGFGWVGCGFGVVGFVSGGLLVFVLDFVIWLLDCWVVVWWVCF